MSIGGGKQASPPWLVQIPLRSACQFCIMPRWLFKNYYYYYYQGLSSLTPVWLAGVGSSLTLELYVKLLLGAKYWQISKVCPAANELFYFEDRGSLENPCWESLGTTCKHHSLSFKHFWLRVSAGKEASSSQLFQTEYKLKDTVAETSKLCLGR